MAVITIHTTMYFVGSPLTSITAAALAIDALAHVGVPLFIVISGFVLAQKDYPVKTFYEKRFWRVVPAYIGASIFYATWLKKPVLESIYNFNAASHLSFFSALFGLYIIYPKLIQIYERNPWAVLGTSLLLQIYPSILPFYPFKYSFFLMYLFYFVLGIHISRNYEAFDKFAKSVPVWSIILLFIPFYCIFISNYLHSFYKINLFFYNVAFEIPAIIIFMLILYRIPNHRIILKIGDWSFGIYLAHMFFIVIISTFLTSSWHLSHTNPIFYILTFCGTLLLSVGVAYIWDCKKIES